MPAIAETRQVAPVESLSPEEGGKRSFDLMTDIANNLGATPEFTTALTQAFFRRQVFPHGSRNEINSVYFQKGDFRYLVDWHSTRFEPRQHGESEARDMIRSRLKITKYDPRDKTDEWANDWAKKI